MSLFQFTAKINKKKTEPKKCRTSLLLCRRLWCIRDRGVGGEVESVGVAAAIARLLLSCATLLLLLGAAASEWSRVRMDRQGRGCVGRCRCRRHSTHTRHTRVAAATLQPTRIVAVRQTRAILQIAFSIHNLRF